MRRISTKVIVAEILWMRLAHQQQFIVSVDVFKAERQIFAFPELLMFLSYTGHIQILKFYRICIKMLLGKLSSLIFSFIILSISSAAFLVSFSSTILASFRLIWMARTENSKFKMKIFPLFLV